MSKQQTDNSFLKDKINLRINHLPDKQIIKVLDVFAGYGKIWSEIKILTNKNINVISIDKENKPNKLFLKGDNFKFLMGIDLNKYDIIDLDAYGIPYNHINLLFKRDYHGIVFVTFIQSITGRLPNGLLLSLGYTKNMINKCPTLFSKNGFEKFGHYLANKNIKNVFVRSSNRKHYICFSMP